MAEILNFLLSVLISEMSSYLHDVHSCVSKPTHPVSSVLSLHNIRSTMISHAVCDRAFIKETNQIFFVRWRPWRHIKHYWINFKFNRYHRLLNHINPTRTAGSLTRLEWKLRQIIDFRRQIRLSFSRFLQLTYLAKIRVVLSQCWNNIVTSGLQLINLLQVAHRFLHAYDFRLFLIHVYLLYFIWSNINHMQPYNTIYLYQQKLR